jgi:LysM repeat protein
MAKVAKQYKISVAELKAANPGIGNGTRAGQLLKIPQK